MLNCIAGLLKNINNNLLLYINNENCLKRFDLERNKKIRDNKKYPAPTFISWGINNRSASIRIPIPKVKDISNYMEEDNKNRRIEFRIPSADADIHLILIGILTSLIDGIDNNLIPHKEKTSFDVMEKNNNFELIENNYYKINDTFYINKDLLYF
jgi:glutamine synthetase